MAKKTKKSEKSLKQVNGYIVVDSVYGQETEKITVRNFADVPVATVGYTLGLTYNMGNYESVRVAITVNLPTYIEELDKAYEYARRFVEEKFAVLDKQIRD
ncbi:MAG: hypothetical protein ABDI07_11815, partial [Candidatus Kryptonium sp.]